MRSSTQSHEPGEEAQPQEMAASKPTHPGVTVIVPVRNDALRLERCLRSILATRHPSERLQVIVADNGSTDQTPQVARALGADVLSCPDVRVGAVRNQAARAARGDVLVFIDADHEIQPDWIPLALEGLAQPRAGAIGAPYTAPADGTWVQQLYDSFRTRPTGVQEVDWLPSGNLAIWRSAFAALDGFDTSLETCEDVDFCQRLKRAGFVLLGDSRLRSVHYGDPLTLRALFMGELWRGRDNLRVSWLGPLTLRALPSIVIPIAGLVLMIAAGIGLLTWPLGGANVVVAAAVGLLLLAALRVARMLRRTSSMGPITVVRSFAVALTYEIARSLALVVRTPHGVRQASALPRAFPRDRRP